MASDGYRSVEKWLSRVSPITSRKHRFSLERWLEWLEENGGKFSNFTPDELVEYQSNVGNSEKYEILDLIQRFVQERPGRYGSKRRHYSALRSFFMHNRVELPKDPTFRIRADTPRVVGSLSPKELRKIILSCNPCYQAVLLCMFQGGMGLGEFEYWNENGYNDLIEALRENPQLIRINLPGRKKTRNIKSFFTFIGKDAITAIRKWLPHRPENAEAIFTNNHDRPLNGRAIELYWLRHLKKLAIIKPKKGKKWGDTSIRYGKGPHEMRDCFRSQWEKSPAKASVAEFCMGHVVDPLEYNKAYKDENWTRREYEKALPHLQIMSSGRPFGQVDEDEVYHLRQELNKRTAEFENLKSKVAYLFEKLPQRIARDYEDAAVPLGPPIKDEYGRPLWPGGPVEMQAVTTPDVKTVARETIKKELGNNSSPSPIATINQNTNQSKPYLSKIITEDELVSHIEDGWEIVRELSNNRFLIRKSNHIS